MNLARTPHPSHPAAIESGHRRPLSATAPVAAFRGASRRHAVAGALSVLAGLGVTGCGGGNGGASAELAAATVASARGAEATRVRLEGCVVDSQWQGAAGVAVHVRTADGRPVNTAFSDARGVYVVDVPARAEIRVDTDPEANAGLAMTTGDHAFSAAACLSAGA